MFLHYLFKMNKKLDINIVKTSCGFKVVKQGALGVFSIRIFKNILKSYFGVLCGFLDQLQLKQTMHEKKKLFQTLHN